jgi:hypothetical protein
MILRDDEMTGSPSKSAVNQMNLRRVCGFAKSGTGRPFLVHSFRLP